MQDKKTTLVAELAAAFDAAMPTTRPAGPVLPMTRPSRSVTTRSVTTSGPWLTQKQYNALAQTRARVQVRPNLTVEGKRAVYALIGNPDFGMGRLLPLLHPAVMAWMWVEVSVAQLDVTDFSKRIRLYEPHPRTNISTTKRDWSAWLAMLSDLDAEDTLSLVSLISMDEDRAALPKNHWETWTVLWLAVASHPEISKLVSVIFPPTEGEK